MQSTSELFGINPKIFLEMSYKEVLEFKLSTATELMKRELKIHYTERDYHKCTKLSKACKNIDRLLKELE